MLAGMSTCTTADLRDRAVAAMGSGMARPEVARVSLRSLERWLARASRRSPQRSAPLGPSPKVAPHQRSVLVTQIAAHADDTLAGHCARWAAATGTRVGVSTMAREVARLGLTVKNNAGRP